MQERWWNHPIGDLYQRAQFGVIQADLFRYWVIHDLGGFYLDINKILIVPLRSLLHQGCDELISFEGTWCHLHRLGLRDCSTLTVWCCNGASVFVPVTHC